MEFPESVLTKGRKGKLEIRGLDHRGSYVMCKYLDPKTMSLADTKRKLVLKDEDGKIRVLHHPIKGSKTGTLNHNRNGGERPPNLER